jgi:RNase P subunit RPR2
MTFEGLDNNNYNKIPLQELSFTQLSWLESDVGRRIRELLDYDYMGKQQEEDLEQLMELNDEIYRVKQRVEVRFIKSCKKNHVCDTCGKTIEKGSSYWNKIYRTVGERGVKKTEKYCEECGTPEPKLELVS